MKTITMPVFRRPQYFKVALESIRKAAPDGYLLLVGIEPGYPEMVEIAEKIDWIERRIVLNGKNLGVDWNNHNVISHAMAMGSVFNVHLEEDVAVAPDAFALAEWYRGRAGIENDVCLGLVNYDSNPGRPRDVLRTWYFSPIGWCTTAAAWKGFFLPNWMCDARGWDWSIAVAMERVKGRSYHPALSRSTHIGREGGVHCTPEHHDKTFAKLTMSAGVNMDGFVAVDEWRR